VGCSTIGTATEFLEAMNVTMIRRLHAFPSGDRSIDGDSEFLHKTPQLFIAWKWRGDKASNGKVGKSTETTETAARSRLFAVVRQDMRPMQTAFVHFMT
jgi:hypothetical protein